MSGVRVVLAACRLQAQFARRSPAQLMVLVTTPVVTSIFLSLALHAGRRDLAVNAVIAPALIGLWFASLDLAGGMIAADRWQGTLEPLAAAPPPLALVVFGRVLAIVGVGTLVFAEAWLVARVAFRAPFPLAHPGAFAAAVAATAFAMAGTATLLSALFVLSRSTMVLQNSMSYPFYILGGVMVPVALLPAWLRPASWLVFLSWSADLLRASTAAAPLHHLPARVAMIAALGAASLAGGVVLVGRVVDRVRRNGTGRYA
jgi:ABC-2 type transport system permease protein